MSNIYQQKYQKYKLKYLNLLNQSGGTKTLEEIEANYAEKKQILQTENSMAIKNASQYGVGDLSDVYKNFNKKEEELEEEFRIEMQQIGLARQPQQQEKMQQQIRIQELQQQELMQQKQQKIRAQNEFEKQKKIMEQQQRAQEQEKMQQQVQMQQQAQKKLEEQQQARMRQQQQQQARMQQQQPQQQPQQVRMQQQPQQQQPQQQTRNDAIVIANETLEGLGPLKNIINEIEKKQIDLKNIINEIEKKQIDLKSIINEIEKNQINLKTNYNCNCQKNGMTLEELKQNEKAEIEQLEKWYSMKKAEFNRKGNGEDIEDAFNQFNKLLIIEKDKHSRLIHTKYEQLKQQQATISNNKKQ